MPLSQGHYYPILLFFTKDHSDLDLTLNSDLDHIIGFYTALYWPRNYYIYIHNMFNTFLNNIIVTSIFNTFLHLEILKLFYTRSFNTFLTLYSTYTHFIACATNVYQNQPGHSCRPIRISNGCYLVRNNLINRKANSVSMKGLNNIIVILSFHYFPLKVIVTLIF